MEKKLEALAQNKEFTDKLAMAQSLEEVAELFAAEGVNISAEELNKALAMVNAEGELGEDELDYVAGGRWANHWKAIGNLLRNTGKWLIC